MQFFIRSDKVLKGFDEEVRHLGGWGPDHLPSLLLFSTCLAAVAGTPHVQWPRSWASKCRSLGLQTNADSLGFATARGFVCHRM